LGLSTANNQNMVVSVSHTAQHYASSLIPRHCWDCTEYPY